MDLNPFDRVPWIRRRYALRFSLALVVIVLVIGLFGGYIYVHTGSELRSDVHSQLDTDTAKDADRLDIWFASTERYLHSVPRSTAFRSDDRVAIADTLQRTTDRTAFSGAYYVDAETGDVDVSAGADDVVDDDRRVTDVADDRLSSAVAADGRVVFSEPFETPEGRPAMLAVSKVPGESDHVVVGLVDLEALSRYMIGEEATNDVIVLDGAGTVVLAGDRSLLLEEDSIDRAAVDGEGTTYVEADDGETVVGYAPVENAGWTLTSRVPAEQAYSLRADISNQILAMLAVVVVSMLALGATVGRTTAGSLRTLSRKAAAIESGNLEEPVESERADELGDLYRSIDRMRGSLRDRLEEAETARSEAEAARTEAETARAEAEAARAESEAFSRRLERRADEYGETMRACADGDLTRRLEPDEESRAMATIATAFNEMMDAVEETVAATRAFADEVEGSAASTADGVLEAREASERVTESIREIDDGAERQNDHLGEVGAEMDDLSRTTEEIASSAQEVATLAGRTATTSADARESARRAIDGMNAIEAEASAAVEEADRLEREIEAIDELLELIRDVSRETNMLALNANIEAARSGGNAAGFTTVAEEIKVLAEETEEAAADVEARLEAAREQADRVATVVRETDERIVERRGDVEASVEALEEISRFAEETSDGVEEISAASEQQAVAAGEVVSMTEDVTAISERTSEETERVTTAATRQTESLVDVSETATSLAERARTLSETLSSFDVGVERPAATVGPTVDSERATLPVGTDD